MAGAVVWNYASIVITAVCGMTFNIIIGNAYPENVLGRFNTVYSYYIVLSQFSACGIHMAVSKFVAQYCGKMESEDTILNEAVWISFFLSLCVSVLGGVVVNLCIPEILGESWLHSMNTIWPALIFFSMNKVILGWLNGCSMMKAYAFFQAARNCLIAASLCVFAYGGLQGELLSVVFFVSESILFLTAVLYLSGHWRLSFVWHGNYYRRLVSFGIRILPANAVLELNTKMDVICLSLILRDEYIVGIYSFAAMFCEGFYQLFVVVRKIINPKITEAWYSGKLTRFIDGLNSRQMKYVYPAGICSLLLLCAGFYGLLWIMGNTSYLQGMPLIVGTCLFMVINAKSIVFGNILSQTGHPAQESLVNIMTTVWNGIANVGLIPFLGMYGAALATGLSYCVFGWAQKRCVVRRLGIVL